MMPSKKKKYNARFPASRIKKIMQTDEEVGKVAQAVPVIISRTLELFVESLLTKSMQITQARNAKTLTPSHMKQCILSESRFDFLKDLVKDIPDPSVQEDNDAGNEAQMLPRALDSPESDDAPEIAANFYTEQGTSSTIRKPVIQYGPKVSRNSKLEIKPSISETNKETPVPTSATGSKTPPSNNSSVDDVPPLVPIAPNFYGQSTGDNLYIDEDYDN